jgi:hypothetical protein
VRAKIASEGRRDHSRLDAQIAAIARFAAASIAMRKVDDVEACGVTPLNP